MRRGRRRTGRTLRALTASLAIAALLGSSAAAAEALPSNFWGVVPQATPTASQLQRLKLGGVKAIRIPIGWEGVQPTRSGPLNWSGADALIGGAARAGIEVLPFITGAPSWAVHSAWVPGSDRTVKAPANLPASGPAAGAWANFLKLAVARYGPTGSFWAENPTIPKRPIDTWQIWNEENFKFFVTRPNPAEYGKLVKLSDAAIEAAEPGAKVLLGGMYARPKKTEGYFASEFLDQMYKRTPGVKADFSGVALHPYTYHYQELTREIEGLRGVLKANHDSNKGLWITEIGWSSEHPSRGDGFAVGLDGQAAQLKGAFNLLRSKQSKWRIEQVYWFSVDDEASTCNFCGGSGLFGTGFRPKPSWKAYVKFAGGLAG